MIIIHYKINHHHYIQCTLFIENYGQGLRREGRRQIIPIKESTAKKVPQLEKDNEKFLQLER